MSPGGRIFRSSRNRPEEPPSSVTVTTAESSPIVVEAPILGVDESSLGVLRRSCTGTNCFNPRSRVDRPVPPPIATTRSALSAAPAVLENGKHTS
jgi:hypothetical protein